MRPRKQTDKELERTIRDDGKYCKLGDVAKFRSQGRPLCVTITMKNGKDHIFPAEIALVALRRHLLPGGRPPILLEMEDVWGNEVAVNTEDIQFWTGTSITRTHCSQCRRQFSPDERSGSACLECLSSNTCSCGEPKEVGRIDCDNCFQRIMGSFLPAVADAFGGKAMEVDLAESLATGEWKEKD